MTDVNSPLSPDMLNQGRRVLHWYDFVCPFCYVGQARNAIFEHYGVEVVDIPFQIHPEIPPEGRTVGQRTGSLYRLIEEEALAAGLPLAWPPRLPNTRMALAAAEWARRQAPQAFPELERALFAAHFVLGEDLGDWAVVERHALAAGFDTAAMRAALDDRSAYELVEQSETVGKSVGISGTPAWYVAGRLIPGLHPREHFEQLAQALASGR